MLTKPAIYRPALALTALLITVPASARAEAINFTGVGPASAVTVGGIKAGTFLAGELNWQWGESGVDIYTYCVDILNGVRSEQPVTVGSTEAMSGVAPSGGGKAAWLFNTYAAGIHLSGNGINAAALQVAIWEALYDPIWDLSGGRFSLVTTGAIQVAANAYLSSLYHPGGYYTSTATWLDTTHGQDQITHVPEPSALLLFACGLVLLAYTQRQRAKIHAVDRAKQS